MTADQSTAGTAGAGFRIPEADHEFQPRRADPGERPVCGICRRERHDTVRREGER